ncbi:MAG: ThuA domain-containing protein [Bryobacteraceae bacterium]|nr:ThuA domain-containing protein [Bryobacteraceae bacterium]
MRNALQVIIMASVLLSLSAQAADKRVLFFSKASSWEQSIVHRDGDQLSFIEKLVQKMGQDHHIEFTFSKDGRIFTPENIAKFDAFFFFTSGDMTFEERNGRGDNYPLMTLEGKKAFLDAIRAGKGFIGCNTANYTFIDPVSPGEKKDPENMWRYTRMIGSGYMGHNEVQKGYFSYLDRKFPGMEHVPESYTPVDQWYAFNRLAPDIHVVMALESGKLTGNLYERPDYPVAWARMEEKGRVFYTTMGHTKEIWADPMFQQMLLGGIRWATGLVDADVTANIAAVTPRYNDIPAGASRFIPAKAPGDNVHFPGFKVWLDEKPHPPANKRVLFLSKSSGYEHPFLYRDTAWPSPLEKEMLQFGHQNNIDFIFTKDSSIFATEKLDQFDAFLFYTSGELTSVARTGPGDNYPVMSTEAKQAFLQAVRKGTGFVAVHSALDTFRQVKDDPYRRMLGAEFAGNGKVQTGRVTATDRAFPGMEKVPAEFSSREEWYAFSAFSPDLHVILALDTSGLSGDLYGRPKYPVAWARMEGNGRVYATSLGHTPETWRDPAFRAMILGALRWTTHTVDFAVTPNVSRVTPAATPGATRN